MSQRDQRLIPIEESPIQEDSKRASPSLSYHVVDSESLTIQESTEPQFSSQVRASPVQSNYSISSSPLSSSSCKSNINLPNNASFDNSWPMTIQDFSLLDILSQIECNNGETKNGDYSDLKLAKLNKLISGGEEMLTPQDFYQVENFLASHRLPSSFASGFPQPNVNHHDLSLSQLSATTTATSAPVTPTFHDNNRQKITNNQNRFPVYPLSQNMHPNANLDEITTDVTSTNMNVENSTDQRKARSVDGASCTDPLRDCNSVVSDDTSSAIHPASDGYISYRSPNMTMLQHSAEQKYDNYDLHDNKAQDAHFHGADKYEKNLISRMKTCGKEELADIREEDGACELDCIVNRQNNCTNEHDEESILEEQGSASIDQFLKYNTPLGMNNNTLAAVQGNDDNRCFSRNDSRFSAGQMPTKIGNGSTSHLLSSLSSLKSNRNVYTTNYPQKMSPQNSSLLIDSMLSKAFISASLDSHSNYTSDDQSTCAPNRFNSDGDMLLFEEFQNSADYLSNHTNKSPSTCQSHFVVDNLKSPQSSISGVGSVQQKIPNVYYGILDFNAESNAHNSNITNNVIHGNNGATNNKNNTSVLPSSSSFIDNANNHYGNSVKPKVVYRNSNHNQLDSSSCPSPRSIDSAQESSKNALNLFQMILVRSKEIAAQLLQESATAGSPDPRGRTIEILLCTLALLGHSNDTANNAASNASSEKLNSGIGGPNFSAPAMLAHPDEFKNPSSFLKIYGDPMCGNLGNGDSSNNNLIDSGNLSAIHPVKGKNGNWMCEYCSNINFPRRFRCNKCNTVRSASGDLIVNEYAKLVYKHHLNAFRVLATQQGMQMCLRKLNRDSCSSNNMANGLKLYSQGVNNQSNHQLNSVDKEQFSGPKGGSLVIEKDSYRRPQISFQNNGHNRVHPGYNNNHDNNAFPTLMSSDNNKHSISALANSLINSNNAQRFSGHSSSTKGVGNYANSTNLKGFASGMGIYQASPACNMSNQNRPRASKRNSLFDSNNNTSTPFSAFKMNNNNSSKSRPQYMISGPPHLMKGSYSNQQLP